MLPLPTAAGEFASEVVKVIGTHMSHEGSIR